MLKYFKNPIVSPIHNDAVDRRKLWFINFLTSILQYFKASFDLLSVLFSKTLLKDNIQRIRNLQFKFYKVN